jgi:Protein of unknown function (DUF3105)
MTNERGKAKKPKVGPTRQDLLQQQRRKSLVRRVIGIAVLVAIAGGAGYCMLDERRFSASVVTTNYPAAQHLSGSLTYRESPPMGGPHNVVWQTCGVYAAPIHNEHAVHSLEHGAVWITYRPDLAAADVQRLKTAAAEDYMLLSPYPGLPAPVVVSAWNQQMKLTGAGDPRLQQFIRRYKNSATNTPEFGASCLGGTVATADKDSLNNAAGAMGR